MIRATDIAFNSQGEMCVSDGYGNKHIVKFDQQGSYAVEWGSLGDGPGHFALPHAIAEDDRGLVYVADRENWRIQVFGMVYSSTSGRISAAHQICSTYQRKNASIPEMLRTGVSARWVQTVR